MLRIVRNDAGDAEPSQSRIHAVERWTPASGRRFREGERHDAVGTPATTFVFLCYRKIAANCMATAKRVMNFVRQLGR